MSRIRLLRLLLVPTIIIAFLPGLFQLRHADGAELTTICCIGDSLTAADYYEAELRTLLGADYTVVNKGIDRNTTAMMLNRFSTDVQDHNPDSVVIWGGVNDLGGGIPLAKIQSNLQSMYTQAHDAGIVVIAISLSPWKGCGAWSASKQVLSDSLHDWIMNTAINIDCRVEVYSPLEDPANPDALLPAYDSGDHLHLNEAGGVVIGQAIYDAVASRLPKAGCHSGSGLSLESQQQSGQVFWHTLSTGD